MTPLRQRMLEDMQIRNFSANTQESYLMQVSLYARHFRRSPEGLGPRDIWDLCDLGHMLVAHPRAARMTCRPTGQLCAVGLPEGRMAGNPPGRHQ
jgi:hypothetical protein